MPSFLLTHSHPQSPFLEPYPGKNSVIVMNNCSIHESALLSLTLQALGEFDALSIPFLRVAGLMSVFRTRIAGVLLVFIPARCPEFNAIEGAFGWSECAEFASSDASQN